MEKNERLVQEISIFLEQHIYRVPNLQFNLLAINCDHASTEFNANGQVVYGLETLVGELKK